MFMQVTTQTQVTAALAQLGNILNTARQGGSWFPRKRYSSRATSNYTPVESNQIESSEPAQANKLDGEWEELLSAMSNRKVVEEVYKLWRQSCQLLSLPDSIPNNRAYISARTFFENKTGFQESSLRTTHYREPFLSFLKSKSPKLRVTPSVVPLYQQSRTFFTRSSDTDKKRSIGIGFRDKDKTEEKSAEKVTKLELGEQFEKGKNTTINIHVKGEDGDGIWGKMGKTWFHRALAVALLYSLIVLWNRNNGKLPGVVSLAPNNFEINPEVVNVTFKDVKGIDEVREELEEIVNFLTNPEKFQKLGARLPKGVLLVGPPGVGKTLVAKAIAGEAGVPFFHASGSEFDEIFVGMGAKRVRQLFGSAKMRAPSIVFIDEIDAVGSKRVNSPFTPHANQTINQLLSEMDGFSTKDGVIVIGATNKKENLDKALLRPGRFDVEIGVTPPDIKGRTEIFELYLKRVKIAEDIDINRLAKLTFGLTGAEISNIVNQAALYAVKENREAITMKDLLYARDKCTMGPEMKNRAITESDKFHTACHEAGHALVAHYSKHADPVNKISVVPRGSSLGHTQMMPERDFTHSSTKQELQARMDVCLGGRVGEELFIGPDDVSVGCSSDFKRATEIARYMVLAVGMSEKVGHRVIHDENGKNEVSNELKFVCDSEVNRLLKESYERAKKVLENHRVEHKRLVEYLMKYENVDKDELPEIIKGSLS